MSSVAGVRFGEHDGFYLINRRVKSIFEHPFLVRREEDWEFCSVEQLKVSDFLFTAAVDSLFRSAGVRPIRLPPRSPNLNAYAERFIRSIKKECLDRMVIFGERRLRSYQRIAA